MKTNTFRNNVRATIRAAIGLAALPVVVGLTMVQGFVVGPVFKNQTAIPNMIYKGLRKLLGYKVEFNKASAPVEKKKPTWFVANHISIADFAVLGGKVGGTFAGKGEILKWPGISQMARAVKYIGLRRSREFNDESRGKIITNFNDGHNTIMFPEGTTTTGERVGLFRAALPKILYGENGVDKKKNEVKLEKDVVVQPVAIKVKEVNGQDATNSDTLRDLYAMYDEDNALKRVWKRLQIKSTTIELTAFAPASPKDFDTAEDLMNHAAREIVTVVNPGQETFEKAAIPTANPKPVATPSA